MASSSEVADILKLAVAGIPKVAQKIASVSAERRAIAFDAVERSYLQTARDLGGAEAASRMWVSAMMFQLRANVDELALVKPKRWKAGTG